MPTETYFYAFCMALKRAGSHSALAATRLTYGTVQEYAWRMHGPVSLPMGPSYEVDRGSKHVSEQHRTSCAPIGVKYVPISSDSIFVSKGTASTTYYVGKSFLLRHIKP